MINVEVSNKNSESAMNLLRKFSQRVNGSGILTRARSLRYYSRPESAQTKKKQALRSIKRIKEVERKIKLGKLPDKRRHRTFRIDDKE